MKITDTRILSLLRTYVVPEPLAAICVRLGVKPHARTGRWSRTAQKQYDAIGAALQRLKRAGKVEYVGGPGAGWRIARSR